MLLCTPTTPNVAPRPTITVASPNAPSVYSGPSRSDAKGPSVGLGSIFSSPLGRGRDVEVDAVGEGAMAARVFRRGGGAALFDKFDEGFCDDRAIPARCVIPFTLRLTGGTDEERCLDRPRERFCRQRRAAGTVRATVVKAS